MDSNRAEYRGKNLRYSLEGGELRINTSDLCSILGVEPQGPDTLTLTGAIGLARVYREDELAGWLLNNFKSHVEADLARFYNEVRAQLRKD